MIEINEVSFSYNGNSFGKLENIDMKIEDGQFVLLCGRSGCGKTTILRLINGLIPDYFEGELKGEVYLTEKNHRKSLSAMEMYERAGIIGSVFQNPRTQFFNVDTDSEIAFGMENMGFDQAYMKRRLKDTTERLGIGKLRNRSIFELSGGEKQKIAFASIYSMGPKVFLLDEPSSNLDMGAIEELREQLAVVKAQGKTVVISEHRIYYLMDLVDRVIYLDQGKICGDYSREEFLALSGEKRSAMGLRDVTRGDVEVEEQRNANNSGHRNISSEGLLLRDVTIRRGRRVIQSGVNLSAKIGDIVGITGENGSGKTTLLRVICGLHKDYTGEILFDGVRVDGKRLRQMAYMVMQDVNYELFADSVERECSLGIQNADREQILKTLEQLDLIAMADHHPNTLSGGQKQRLAVAVGKICGKQILIFDEPTSGLDLDSMRKVAMLIGSLSREAIILIVTHDIEFINRTCTKVFKLNRREEIEKKE